MTALNRSVGMVAAIAGVTVRTLHHYDHTGLLRPSGRTAAGYRSYAADDLMRLQRILCYRRLGMRLAEIRRLVDGEDADAIAQLRRQHRILGDRIQELGRMRRSVETMMEAQRMGLQLDPAEILEIFGDRDPTRYAEEAERRWGATEAWAESRRRATVDTKDDWQRNLSEFDDICARFAAASAAGLAAGGTEAMAVAEAHRRHIETVYYPCWYDMHRGLAQLYVADSRFAQTFERLAEGLSRYVHDAICANARAHGGD